MRIILAIILTLATWAGVLPGASEAAVTPSPILRYEAATLIVTACRPNDRKLLVFDRNETRRGTQPTLYYVAPTIVVKGRRRPVLRSVSGTWSLPARRRGVEICCRPAPRSDNGRATGGRHSARQ